VVRSSLRLVLGSWVAAIVFALCPLIAARAESPSWQQGNQHKGNHGKGNHDGKGSWSGYQRHTFDKGFKHDDKRRRKDFKGWTSPQISSAWFQRPYPYHLDYYRMKYHGSYAPYFGNLYGPPQVVTAPPYYGPYYGNWGLGAGDNAPGDYGNPVYQRGPVQFPIGPEEFLQEVPVESSTPTVKQGAATKDENLPTP
jgi:hypothetical protein